MSKILKIDGITIKDSKKPLMVTITRNDVKQGAKKNQHTCAAAVALCHQFEKAQVHLTRVYVKQGNKYVRYATPAALRSEIISFDRGGKFAPGNYILQKIKPSAKAGMRAKQGGKKSGTSGSGPYRTQRKRHIVTGIRPSFSA